MYLKIIAIIAVVVIGVMTTIPLTLRVYRRSLRLTVEHRRYLLANGATPLESLLPSVRRALRVALPPLLLIHRSPLRVALPMLLCGLLIGGATLLGAVTTALLLWLAALMATMLVAVVSMLIIGRTADKP